MINNEIKLEWWNINYRKKEHLCHRARWKGKPDLADVIVDNSNSKSQIIYSTRLASLAHQRFKRRKKWWQELITLSSLTVIVPTIYCSETTIYLLIFCTDGHKRTLNSLPECVSECVYQVCGTFEMEQQKKFSTTGNTHNTIIIIVAVSFSVWLKYCLYIYAFELITDLKIANIKCCSFK